MPIQTYIKTENVFTKTNPLTENCLIDDCGCKLKCNVGNLASGNSFFRTNDNNYFGLIKPITYKQYDTFVTTIPLEEQGVYVKQKMDLNVTIRCSNKRIEEISGYKSCDQEDYDSTNRNIRNANLKSKNQLLLSMDPFNIASYDIFKFQVEKYFLNVDCVEGEYYIGQPVNGGIICYLDETKEHGIAVPRAFSSKYWHSTNGDFINATNDGLYSGMTNTNLIVSSYGSENNIAKYISDFTTSNYSDYYLPSKYELNLVYKHFDLFCYTENNRNLSVDDYFVWSSTENDASTAWAQNLITGEQRVFNKTTQLRSIMISYF